MLKPPIALHKSFLCLQLRVCIEVERAGEQVKAQLVPLTEEVWGYFCCQEPREIIKHW